MSFGDTMTTLLAFFIVLCSMAEDQSGANLHTGTGSFIQTLNSGGAPGSFSAGKSERAVQLQATNPLYMLQHYTDLEATKDGNGPDEAANEIPTKDREADEFKRFLNELERMSRVKPTPNTTGEITFDFFDKLSTETPHLPRNFEEIMARVVPFLRKKTHRIELRVWATTPSRSARTRASLQSGRIVAHMLRNAGLSDADEKRIFGTGTPWPYKDLKRPVISIVIRRVDAGLAKSS